MVSATERLEGAVIILSSVLCYVHVLKHGNIKQRETKKKVSFFFVYYVIMLQNVCDEVWCRIGFCQHLMFGSNTVGIPHSFRC